MSEVRIFYPELSRLVDEPVVERLATEPLEASTASLLVHPRFMPLAPGDVVAVGSDGEVTGIVSMVRLFTYEVWFKTPADLALGRVLHPEEPSQRAITATISRWHRDAWVTRDSGLSCYVSSQTEAWLDDCVVGCRYVDFAEVVRRPGMAIDFDVARNTTEFGDLTIGPWA